MRESKTEVTHQESRINHEPYGRHALVTIDPFEAINVPWSHGDPVKLAANLRNDRERGRPAAMPFVAVIIKAGLKAKLLRYLENTYNRSARILFPDYAGFLEFRSEPAARVPVADEEI